LLLRSIPGDLQAELTRMSLWSRVMSRSRRLGASAILGVSFWIALGPARAATKNDSVSGDRPSEVELFIEKMAEKHGFGRGELKEIFRQARFRRNVIRAMSSPAEAKPWDVYRSRFVNASRIQGGLKFWSDHAQSLVFAHRAYGVPEEITTAVIGVETSYGKDTGSFRVLDALATLAFNYPKRAADFRRELEHYLLLAREEGWRPSSVKGSYAGAIGPAQFMPTSYRQYGVDFDGDGKRDLSQNIVDAIGSVANYLMAHGWVANQPVIVPARVTPEPSRHLPAGLHRRHSVDEWKQLGVLPEKEVPGHLEAMLIVLGTKKGPKYWLGFRNFYVITRYNHSTHYAMAVYQLSREIESLRRQARAIPSPLAPATFGLPPR
jgi:membrane-bound lytic murein transglycosylase B